LIGAEKRRTASTAEPMGLGSGLLVSLPEATGLQMKKALLHRLHGRLR
jgi:hypothetical protein